MSLENKIEQAANLIRDSRRMIAFTGAGHSTPSGIPDYRSPKSGLWANSNPMFVASIWSFRLEPKLFFAWAGPLIRTLAEAHPNPAHLALAQLESQGTLKAIITQNIDNLHQRAGSQHVLEIHGTLRTATCVRCYKHIPVDKPLEATLLRGKVPRCECGGVLKPDVILFGEQLPLPVYNRAFELAQETDLMLVAGSSLSVTPAADLPFLAVDCGAKSIIVNLEPTAFDCRADIVIHADVTDILPRLASLAAPR